MKLSVTHTDTIMEILNDFCALAGLKESDNMVLVASYIKKQKGHVDKTLFSKALENYINGLIEVKQPYKISNLFLNQIIQRQLELSTAIKGNIKPPPPQEEKDRIMDEGIKNYIQQTKEGNKPDCFTWHYYDYLEEKGKIELSVDEKLKLMDLATEEYKKQRAIELNETNSRDRRKQIQELINSNTTEEEKIKRIAKEIAFDKWAAI